MASISVAHAASSPSVLSVSDDFTALVAELIDDDDLYELEATSQAVALLDDLDAYAAVWNSWTYSYGNDDALDYV